MLWDLGSRLSEAVMYHDTFHGLNNLILSLIALGL